MRTGEKKPWEWTFASWHPYALFLILIAAAYARTIGFGFTYFDDDTIILKQFSSISSFSQIGNAFTTFILPPYYRPILTLSFMIDAAIGGNAPWIYHLTAIFWHFAAVCLLFYLLLKLGIPRLPAFLSSCIMAVHPLTVHAVAWIPGRNDPLLMVFFLLSMITLLRVKESPSPINVLFHATAFFLAIFSKETALVFPAIALAWIGLVRKEKLLDKANVPLFIGWGTVIALWLFLRPSTAAWTSHENDYYSMAAFIANLPTIPELFGKIVIPVNLSVYPKFSSASTIGGIIIIVLIAGIFLKERKMPPPLALFALVWMLVLQLPGMAVQTYDSANRFDYVESRFYGSLAGFAILLPVILQNLFREKEKNAVYAFAVIFAVFCGTSISRSGYYSDALTFWTQATIDAPHAASPHFSRGVVIMKISRDPAAAAISYREAIALDPGNYRYHNNLGRAYEMMGRLDDAAGEYRLAMDQNPSDPVSPFNLGNVAYRKKDFAGAEMFWSRACSLDVNFTEARKRLMFLTSRFHPNGENPDAPEH
jgi:protein O-mannosyl-transferase